MSLIDEVESFRQRISERLQELEPLVQEYQELKRIAAELGVEEEHPGLAPVPGGDTAAAAAARTVSTTRSGRSRRRARAPAAGGNRRGDGTDLGEGVLDAVRAEPGKTVADYARILGVSPTQLYRPVRELTTEGELVKRARQLFPG